MSELGLDSVATEQRGFGGLLREWRTARGLSQLTLSMRGGVSSRHLSYMETGRAMPSRDMVLALAQALEIPLRDRNALLQAAGFAAIYRETPLQAQPMGPVRDAINLLLRSTEPNPTFVVNRRYDILDSNETGRWLLATPRSSPLSRVTAETRHHFRYCHAERSCHGALRRSQKQPRS